MAEHSAMPRMNWSSADIAGTFSLFKQKCQILFAVKEIKGENMVNYILMYIGDEGLRIYNSWTLSENDKADPNVVWKKFESHIEPKVNFRVQRFYLQKYSQSETESIDDYMARCKLQALKCKFSQNEAEERLIEQLIVGTNLSELQKELLGTDDKLTLEQALNIGRTHEASISHMSQLQGVQTRQADIHYVKTGGKTSCYFCARSHPKNGRCPAFGTLCKRCGGKNHWQVACRKSTYTKQNHRGRGRGNGRGRSRSRNRHGDESGKRDCDGWSHKNDGKRGVHAVTRDNEESRDDMTSQFEHLSFATMSLLPNERDNRDEVFAKLDIGLSNKDRRQTADLKVKVDTGAQGNILPLRIFRRMFPEKLTAEGYPSHGAVTPRSNTTLSAYNGSNIPQYGSISLPCSYSTTEWVNAEFYIADTDGPAILGLPNSRQLQIVTLHCAIDKDTRSTRDMDPVKSVQELKEQYPDRFDTLGQFPGTYHIVTDPTVQPMIHAPRKCPIQMKDELQSAFNKI